MVEVEADSTVPTAPEAKGRGGLGMILRFLAFGMLFAGVALLAKLTPLGDHFARLVGTLGEAADKPWAPFAFVGIYAVAVASGLPGSLLTALGGIAFGMLGGFCLNMIGALLGATLAFFEARVLGRGLLRRMFGKYAERLNGLEKGRSAFVTIMRLRFMPIVPYNGLNFAAGLTKIRYWPYIGGTAVGIIPSTLLFTFFATALAAGGAARADASWKLGLALGGLMLLSLLPEVPKLVRKLTKRPKALTPQR
jgi:uncharacterized membrane protein YdjX (TVP38/TMEM64 family)